MKKLGLQNHALSAYPKKNVLTSLLWLSGITFPSSSLAFVLSPWPQGAIIFLIGCLPTLATLWYYKHWASKDPDRLQTEDFRIKVEALAKIGRPDGTVITVDPHSELTANNAVKEIGKDQ